MRQGNHGDDPTKMAYMVNKEAFGKKVESWSSSVKRPRRNQRSTWKPHGQALHQKPAPPLSHGV